MVCLAKTTDNQCTISPCNFFHSVILTFRNSMWPIWCLRLRRFAVTINVGESRTVRGREIGDQNYANSAVASNHLSENLSHAQCACELVKQTSDDGGASLARFFTREGREVEDCIESCCLMVVRLGPLWAPRHLEYLFHCVIGFGARRGKEIGNRNGGDHLYFILMSLAY